MPINPNSVMLNHPPVQFRAKDAPVTKIGDAVQYGNYEISVHNSGRFCQSYLKHSYIKQGQFEQPLSASYTKMFDRTFTRAFVESYVPGASFDKVFAAAKFEAISNAQSLLIAPTKPPRAPVQADVMTPGETSAMATVPKTAAFDEAFEPDISHEEAAEIGANYVAGLFDSIETGETVDAMPSTPQASAQLPHQNAMEAMREWIPASTIDTETHPKSVATSQEPPAAQARPKKWWSKLFTGKKDSTAKSQAIANGAGPILLSKKGKAKALVEQRFHIIELLARDSMTTKLPGYNKASSEEYSRLHKAAYTEKSRASPIADIRVDSSASKMELYDAASKHAIEQMKAGGNASHIAYADMISSATQDINKVLESLLKTMGSMKPTEANKVLAAHLKSQR